MLRISNERNHIMAVLKHGINGPFSGKVGSVIGVVKDGRQEIRGPHKKRTKKISEKEKHNRKRFSTAQKWLLPVLPFVRKGFSINGKTTTSFIRAVGNVLKTALIAEENELRVDPRLVTLSQGPLSVPQNINTRLINDKFLEVTWEPALSSRHGGDDQTFIAVYDPSSPSLAGTLMGAFRKTGMEVIELSGATNCTYHVYFAMVSADRLHHSNSIYLGELSL